MIYELLAPVYDAINKDIDYPAWADFIESCLTKDYLSDRRAELILDLATGTGKMAIELARRGYDMTAVDISSEMLDIGRSRAQQMGLDILWLCQDMRSFELYGTVDAVVCCLDSINHLTGSGDLRRCFDLVHNYLYPGGLFIFDVNGRGKFERVYSDRTYVFEERDSFCVWENFYDADKGICDFYITLFEEQGDGSYIRHDEIQRERVYTLRSLRSMLKRSGFELVGAYSDFERTPGTDDDDRLYLVARCIKEV